MSITFIRRLVFCLSLLLSSFAISSFAQDSFIYTNNHGSITISGFSIGPGGSLIQIPGSPFPRGGFDFGGGFISAHMITSVRIGNFLYASSRDSGTISAFTINPSTGFLSPVSGSPFPTGTLEQTSLAATPDGRFLLQGSLSLSGRTEIAVFSISADVAHIISVKELRSGFKF